MHFQSLVFDTIIPRNVKLSESPSYGLPVLLHDAESKGAISYLNLAREIGLKNGLLEVDEEALAAQAAAEAADAAQVIQAAATPEEADPAPRAQ